MDEFIATLNVEIENCEAEFLAMESEFYAAAQVSATANLHHAFERFKSVGDDLLLLLTIREVLLAWIEEHHIADPVLVGPDGADVSEEHNPAAPVDTEEPNTAAPEEAEEPNTAAPEEAEEPNTATPEGTTEPNRAAPGEMVEYNTAASEVSVEDNWHQNALDPNKKD